MFVVPADTFDNVKGKFPIGFMIWNTDKKEDFTETETDVYERNGEFFGKKMVTSLSNKTLNNWFTLYKDDKGNDIGKLSFYPSDYQNNGKFSILSVPQARYCLNITQNNLIQTAAYFAVRHCIEATWLNDRDQFFVSK